MKLTKYQTRIIEKLKNGWLIETDGTGAELVHERKRMKIKYPSFEAIRNKELIELCGFRSIGINIEIYKITDND